MFSAVHAREGIDLDMLHKSDHAPIRYARICRKDGQEIPWDDIVKGYEYRDGDYVVLSQKELDSIDAKRTQTIDIQQFVDQSARREIGFKSNNGIDETGLVREADRFGAVKRRTPGNGA